MKGESIEEIVALAKTMKEFANRIKPTHGSRLVDIVGTGGDKMRATASAAGDLECFITNNFSFFFWIFYLA